MNKLINRQIVVDTETTGINKFGIYYEGHNIIEIGAVELINRRLTGKKFHEYIKPERLIDHEAFKIHGISDEFLRDKPVIGDIADDFLKFISGSELIIHNAAFDIGFIDYEFGKLKKKIPPISKICTITDSLLIARKLFPGKRNNLDSLCNRYLIDKSKRTFHGALLDAEILSDIYLLMTGGQVSFSFSTDIEFFNKKYIQKIEKIERNKNILKVLYASSDEIIEHNLLLDLIEKKIR
ncbi:DNA polymerase III subunit epsilon [Candidatus Providencia siddallii]|uniref:DNA polymerase III subunit epsilon n=1 Tax=Candidatus Providencia siddallii TaxID=1715285 RepID=A0A0M6W980_9GAMM|nr:DNA polymerase III subunit epsilon [Candidatus Providencia siddallii]